MLCCPIILSVPHAINHTTSCSAAHAIFRAPAWGFCAL